MTIGRATLVNRGTSFEGLNVVADHCEILSSIIGRGTYIAPGTVLRRTRIGRFCSIGSGVRTSLGRHPTSDFVSTHPAFFSLKKQEGFTFVDQTLFEEHVFVDDGDFVAEIGNDVWIGNNVSIVDGVRIGDGAVIGTGALVAKDIAPYSIQVGLPARHIRYRFDAETIDQLLQIRWWDQDLSWLRENAHLFTSVERLKKHFSNKSP